MTCGVFSGLIDGDILLIEIAVNPKHIVTYLVFNFLNFTMSVAVEQSCSGATIEMR